MTMKTRVSRFRIRPGAHSGGAAAEAQAEPEAQARAPQPDQAPPGEAQGAAPGTDPAAIREETLTGRELRMARRLAQKHGLSPGSDLEAVRMLRERGIDPFQRSGMFGLVSGEARAAGAQEGMPGVQLPQTVAPPRDNLPARDISPAQRRAAEIIAIQRDIARRRRRKLALLMARLLAFVFLPTFLAGYYFSAVATPMYASNSAFLILSADGGIGGGRGGLGGLIPSQFATGQDAIATQEYLESKDAMLRLDEEQGFRAHFSDPAIDPIQRLDPDASNEAAYKLYRRHVKIGYDPTEGVMRMEVLAADPETSLRFNQQLIAYAEERVDELSRDKRNDAVKVAAESLAEAKAERRAAQQRLVALQEDTILDPEGEIASIRSLIGSVEMQLQEKELALSIQMNNTRPNAARVTALQSEIAVLRAELERQKRRLTEATEGDSSLASKTAAIQMAQADLATADMVLQSALEAMRMSETEANKQVRYLTVSARPIKPQEASYPKVFENTVLAFLIFSGIYLMVSLTASILREQVTS